MVDVTAHEVVQQPLPEGIVAPGTLVWGSDFNAACTLLYRLWGVIDAPPAIDTGPQWHGLLTDGAKLHLPGFVADGPSALRRELDRHRATESTAHHLAYDDVRVAWRDEDALELTARYMVQRLAGDEVAIEHEETARVTLVRTQEGGLAIDGIETKRQGDSSDAPFRNSYQENRGRATIVQFQAHMDSLSGRLGSIGDLLADRLELHGLVASKRDESARGTDLTDVNALRKSVAGSDTVDDNAIRTHAGFAEWFATAPALFRYGLHRLEHFAIRPLEDDRYETIAQFDWRAETVNGARIETHQPLTWIMVETGEKYMRIEKLLPFG